MDLHGRGRAGASQFATKQGNRYFRLITGVTINYAQGSPFTAKQISQLEPDVRKCQGEARLDLPARESSSSDPGSAKN